MGKVKSLIEPEIYGKLAKQTQPGISLTGTSLTISPQSGLTVLKTATPPTDRSTPAQTWQRELYKDADCFWRSMSQAQRRRWTEFYSDHPELWANQKSAKTSAARTTVQAESKNLSERALFMRMALNFNLLEFLEDYLKAKWALTSYSKEGGRIKVTARVVLSASDLTVDYMDMYARTNRIRG